MSDAFKHLLSPSKMKDLSIRNRMVVSAHIPNYSTPEGYVTQREIDYHEARARGGVGLIIISASYISTMAKEFYYQPGIWHDSHVEAFKRLTTAVKRHGARIGLQILHPGRQGDPTMSGFPVVAPSPIPCPIMQAPPVALSIPAIKEIVAQFGQAARRAREAGFELIELHGAHGYLFSQFLSPYSNKRTDRYGGSFENRVRFALEVCQAVREQIGPQMPLSFRISADEFVDGGLQLRDTSEVVKLLEKEGTVDVINVSASVFTDTGTTIMCIPTMEIPSFHIEHLSAGIKEVVNLPVIAHSRLNEPELAETMLERGSVDFCVMTRAHIADPDIGVKIKEGRHEEIRKCISCNQGCVDRLFEQLDVTCTMNPEVGRERQYAIRSTPKKKEVTIVGAGPAGMECARVLTLRGHKVTLYEKEKEVGGQNIVAKLAPLREEMGDVTRYLQREMLRLKVDIRFNEEMNPDKVMALNPECVVVATGAEPFIPSIPGVELPSGYRAPYCTTFLQVFKREALGQKRAVVLGATSIGLECAEILADQGREVTVIERLHHLPDDFYGFMVQALLLKRLREKGVKILLGISIYEAREGEVLIDRTGDRLSGLGQPLMVPQEPQAIPCDLVVLATGRKPLSALYEGLQGKVEELYAIGDCVEPRVVFKAMADAARVARLI